VSGYSARWRSVFGVVDPARTEADVRFLAVALPLPAFRRVLDVPCGDGRHHLHALSALGYDVTGVDNDPAVAPPMLADLRELDSLPRGFDAAINMWQSFGYFDAAENEQVLGSFARRLRPGGRLVLDLQNRDFFEPRDPTERELRPGTVERSWLENGRRHVELDYGDGVLDVFEWQLYAPEELEALAARHGLAPLVRVASPTEPTMRLLLERDP
jgi:SAM-dependent methyltransferase